jgi:hypothetical protein
LSNNSEPEDDDSLPLSSLEPSVASTLDSLCLEYRRLGSEIDSREITRKDLKEEIERLVLTLPVKRIFAPGWRTTKSQKITHPLDKRLLVTECNNREIDPITVLEVIKAASPEKKGKEYVSILAPGKEDDKEDSHSHSSKVFD